MKVREKYRDNAIYISLSLLNKQDQVKVILMTLAQILFSIMDLLGVALLAILGSIAVTSSSSRSNGDRVASVLNFLHLSNSPIQTQAASHDERGRSGGRCCVWLLSNAAGGDGE